MYCKNIFKIYLIEMEFESEFEDRIYFVFGYICYLLL